MSLTLEEIQILHAALKFGTRISKSRLSIMSQAEDTSPYFRVILSIDRLIMDNLLERDDMLYSLTEKGYQALRTSVKDLQKFTDDLQTTLHLKAFKP